METPAQAKARGHKFIERNIVRVLTPGTLTDENLLTPKNSNFLVAISPIGGGKYDIAGKSSQAENYRDADFIVAIGNSKIRRKIQEELTEKQLSVVSLIHPSAVIADSVKIGEGTVVAAGAVINPYAEIGKGCIINTCASVDHDCNIGDFVHISVGSHVAGTVVIKENTWIGAGAVVSNNIEVTADCMIGAGAVVLDDVLDYSLVVGVPAKHIGWVCECGNRLEECLVCNMCGKNYIKTEYGLEEK
jgi:sugar O-acyltransferase (sialic acid O-acetyltransferase NeuD family)